jgi:hypothetical protein
MGSGEDPAGPLSMVRKHRGVFGERAEGQEKIPAGGFYSVSPEPIRFAFPFLAGIERVEGVGEPRSVPRVGGSRSYATVRNRGFRKRSEAKPSEQ